MIIKPTCTSAGLFSGDRFSVTYHIAGGEKDARAKAEDSCIEQTVEFPADEVPAGIIRDHVFGRIESFSHAGSPPPAPGSPASSSPSSRR